MPRLSDSMEEGTILRWLVADGDVVSRGQEIVEIETDKATMPYEADDEGPLHIVAAEGSTLAIGATIATIGEGAPAPAAAPAADAAPAEAAAPSADEAPATEVAEPVAAPAPAPAAAEPVPAGVGAATNGHGGRVKASPVARRLARESSIDLQSLTGTGPAGRIVKADVLSALQAGGTAAPAPAPAPAAAPAAAPAPEPAAAPAAAAAGGNKGEVTVQELNRTQQVVARRMAESRATVPDFEVSIDIDMEAARELRAQLKAAAGEDQPVPSFNDMVVKAAALVLKEFPRANGSYKDGAFELHSRINVGIAVATDDGLIVPTVFDADAKSLGEIARTTRALATSVREGTIRPPELSGGTFTVSNLGMFGVTHFTAVINVPQAAILAVGAMEPRAVVRDGEIVARHTMTVTLASDHRILYGADSARFVSRVKALLENPLQLAF
jgi:pyruvate dehydrogenase E2 component (dihydrolipoamide acetyltransferase)